VETKIVSVMLALVGSHASAAFVSETYSVPGEATQQTYARLQAVVAGDGDEHELKPIAIPYLDSMSASKTSAKGASTVDETYNFGPSMLRVDTTKISLTGSAQGVSDGGWVFSVTENVRAEVSGYLDVRPTGPTENWLYAHLLDRTTGLELFESNQLDLSDGTTYYLGGLTGSHQASFTGNLANTFLTGHTYQLLYRVAVGSQAELAGLSLADARIQLLAIPEPSTSVLLSLGLLAVGTRKIRRSYDPPC